MEKLNNKVNKKRKVLIKILVFILAIYLLLFLINRVKSYTLEGGAWVVGKDVPAGEYIVTTNSENGGNITIVDELGNTVDSESMSSSGEYGVTSVKVSLEEGYIINNETQGDIELHKTKIFNFNSYTTGIWQVGDEIKPGTYTLTLDEDSLGSIVVYDVEGQPVISEMMDSNGVYGKKEIQITLEEGQTLEISGVSTIHLK